MCLGSKCIISETFALGHPAFVYKDSAVSLQKILIFSERKSQIRILSKSHGTTNENISSQI